MKMNFKTEDTELIICPNCGEEVDDSHDLFNDNEVEIEISCLHCNQRIKAEVRRIPIYTSFKISEE